MAPSFCRPSALAAAAAAGAAATATAFAVTNTGALSPALRGAPRSDLGRAQAPATAASSSVPPLAITVGAAGAALAAVVAAARRKPCGAGAAVRRTPAVKVEALNRRGPQRMPKPVFDPIGLCDDAEAFQNLRSVEVVFARLAMLAAVGLPIAELTHESIAESIGLPSRLAEGGRGPMLINGGHFSPMWEAIIGLTLAGLGLAAAELRARKQEADKKGVEAVPGPEDLLNPMPNKKLSPVLRLLLSNGELFNGRLAMMAIVAMMGQEVMTGEPLHMTTPGFFGAQL